MCQGEFVMFDDSDGLVAHSDIGEVLPCLTELHSGVTEEAVEQLKAMVESDNKYAAYVLGSLFMFGRTPRFYIFNKTYEVGEVKRRSIVKIQEELGFSYWVNLLKLKGAEIEDFHLEGLYDLYKVMQGSSEFFATNDISCRPKDESHPMYKLFSSERQLRDFLYRQNHFEVYLDVARDALKNFEESPCEEDMKLAVDCLTKILSGDIFSRYSQYEISHANLEAGKLYLVGNAYLERDMPKAIAYLTASKLDEAYVYLLDYYKQFGDKYKLSIRKCIGMIRDDKLRVKLYHENNLVPPAEVDLVDSLNLLIATRRKAVALNDYALDGDLIIKVPKIVNEKQVSQADAEIAASFDPIDFDGEGDLDLDLSQDDSLVDDDDIMHDASDEYSLDMIDPMDHDFEIVD